METFEQIENMKWLMVKYPDVYWWFDDQYMTAGHHDDSKLFFKEQTECDMENQRIFLIMMEKMDIKISEARSRAQRHLDQINLLRDKPLEKIKWK